MSRSARRLVLVLVAALACLAVGTSSASAAKRYYTLSNYEAKTAAAWYLAHADQQARICGYSRAFNSAVAQLGSLPGRWVALDPIRGSAVSFLAGLGSRWAGTTSRCDAAWRLIHVGWYFANHGSGNMCPCPVRERVSWIDQTWPRPNVYELGIKLGSRFGNRSSELATFRAKNVDFLKLSRVF